MSVFDENVKTIEARIDELRRDRNAAIARAERAEVERGWIKNEFDILMARYKAQRAVLEDLAATCERFQILQGAACVKNARELLAGAPR